MNSIDTKDGDRDKTMRGADIFDIAHFPTAHYVTKSFTKTATGYTGRRLTHAATASPRTCPSVSNSHRLLRPSSKARAT